MTQAIRWKRSVLVFHGSVTEVNPDWRESLAPLSLDVPQQWSRFDRGEVASASRSTNSYKVTLESGEVVFFKRYVYFTRRLRSLLIPSKATVEAWGLSELHRLGCRTPEVLAVGERRVLGNVRAAFVVTREIVDSISLAELAETAAEKPGSLLGQRQINDIAADLIPQLQAMHRAGFFHYDLKWRNLMVQDPDSECRVYVIDCPRARRHRWRRFRGQVVDLSALSRVAVSRLSKIQRLRFFIRYLGPGYDRTRARRLLSAVNAHLSRRPPRGWKAAP